MGAAHTAPICPFFLKRDPKFDLLPKVEPRSGVDGPYPKNSDNVESTVNPRQAKQLAQDLGIRVVPIFTDSLSAADGPAATYLDFMRYNVGAIVGALGEGK